MKIRSEKGFTGVDVAISVVILFIFVSIIAVLSYNYSSSAKQIELESEATYLAINEIEAMKNLGFEGIADFEKDATNKGEFKPLEEIENEEGFYRKVIVEDYADINPDKTPGIVKKVTVQVTYMFKGKQQKVELSTVLSKEN